LIITDYFTIFCSVIAIQTQGKNTRKRYHKRLLRSDLGSFAFLVESTGHSIFYKEMIPSSDLKISFILLTISLRDSLQFFRNSIPLFLKKFLKA